MAWADALGVGAWADVVVVGVLVFFDFGLAAAAADRRNESTQRIAFSQTKVTPGLWRQSKLDGCQAAN